MFYFNCFLNRIYYIQRHKLIMLSYISLPFAHDLWQGYINAKMYVKGGKRYRFSLFTFIEFSNSEVPHLCLSSSCCSCKTCKHHGSFKQAFPSFIQREKISGHLTMYIYAEVGSEQHWLYSKSVALNYQPAIKYSTNHFFSRMC